MHPRSALIKKVGQRQDWRYAILLYFFANAHCSATDEPGREAGPQSEAEPAARLVPY